MQQPITSPEDKREYRLVELPNGLRCLLIHDAEIAASMAEGGDDESCGDESGSGSCDGASDDEDLMAPYVCDIAAHNGPQFKLKLCGCQKRRKRSQPASEGESGGESDGEDDDDEEDEGGAVGGKRAACALSVGVGSFHDPAAHPGLAHLLEHVSGAALQLLTMI